jgi:2-phosphosulfolactate phosphatase
VRGPTKPAKVADVADNVFRQLDYGIRLEWGGHGVAALADCAVLIVVDVLSFTTSVDIAVSRGARIWPLSIGDTVETAREAGAVLAGEREWSLRPASLTDIPDGTLLAVPSPNGATLCVQAAATGATVFAGCLRNVTAVARAAARHAGHRPIGVIAAGERWGVTDGPLRPCVEDYLGAGAILDALTKLTGNPSPEARIAARAAQHVNVAAVLAECSSGRELRERGDGRDIALAAQLDISATAPILVNGVFTTTGST